MPSLGEIEINTEQQTEQVRQIETKVEYIDRHHFHYDFNVIHSDGNQVLPNQNFTANHSSSDKEAEKKEQPNFEESMLLDSE